MKFAVIGSGGREHAICWKLAQTLGEKNVYCLPGNGGIPNSVSIDTNSFEAIEGFCNEHEIDYIFVGPEQPLSEGIVDYFRQRNIAVFGPTKQAAQLEGSKIFSKNFMQKYGVSTAPFKTFTSVHDALDLIHEKKGDLVVKYDGLAAGKGVWVCSSIDEAMEAMNELELGYGSNCRFLIEDKVIGDEISIIGFTDGETIKLLLPSQDHKQLLEGDKGPNTGGMGVICPVPFWNDQLHDQIQLQIVNPTLRGIAAENMDYKGIIYFGIMMGKDGPSLLEYNVRFGDPETEVLLPSLKTDLSDIIVRCLDGTLGEIELEFEDGYFVDVVMVSGGYPKAYKKGYQIEGLESTEALVFHAGTKRLEGAYLTNGGRVLNIIGQDEHLEKAIEKAYAACAEIHFKDSFCRKDIGKRVYKFF